MIQEGDQKDEETYEYVPEEVAAGVESEDDDDDRIEEVIEDYISDHFEEIENCPD